MKLRFALSIVLLMTCVSLFGQQGKSNPAQKPTLQELSITINNQQNEITELHDENDCLKQQLEEFEKEVVFLKSREDFIDDKLSHWLVILSITISAIVTILGGFFGIVAPLIIKRRNEKKMEERMKFIIKLFDDKIRKVQDQADKAAKSLFSIEGIKKDINIIKADIDKSKKDAQRAAIKAKASELFSQALKEEDNSKAIELFSKYLQLDPSSNTGYFHRGLKKSINEDFKGAIDDFTKAISINNNDYLSYANRAICKEKIGDLNGAMTDYDKALEIKPENFDILVHRASLEVDIQKYEKALVDLNKALELDSESTGAFNDRGNLYLLMGEPDKALIDINRAIEIDNNHSVNYVTKGEIYLNTKKYTEAIENFTKALSFDTIHVDHKKIALSNRAKCYRILANDETNDDLRKEYIDKAIADEKEASSLS